MSIKYDSKREPLAEIMKKATINATYVIPDLQRPYVWSPSKVIMLVDSLFRGWPFGSLLLWEVKPDCFQKNEGIPHRPFWQVIDRTGNDKGTTNSALGQPATCQMVLDGQQRVQSLRLVENQGSFNAIIVWLTWYRLVFDRLEAVSIGLSVVEQDSLEKKLDGHAARFLDRWVFGSQWANVWGDGAVVNFQNFATDLNGFYIKLMACNASNLIAMAEEGVGLLMGRVADKAAQRINTVIVGDRRRVHDYYPFLWVWHRLEELRWEHSSVQLRTGRKRTSKLEVDHTVADALWTRLVDDEIKTKQAGFEGSNEERASLAPDDFESRATAVAFVNLLGNCSLLDKSFNISKSDKPMWGFMKDVEEFKSGTKPRHVWETALSLSETLTAPDESTLAEIRKAILARDVLIRKDLADFIAGTRQRVD